MADFNQPTNTTLYTLVLSALRNSIISALTWMDGTSDSNLPDKAKRYNASNNKFEIYATSTGTWSELGFHTGVTNQIASAVNAATTPIGAIFLWPGASVPSGYLKCQGAVLNRVQYASLYAALGGASSPWGQGDGSTTFNAPNLALRLPMGRTTSGTHSAMGYAAGTIDHAHSIPTHTHTIQPHLHNISHSHALNDHTHTGPSHDHSVPAHSHDAQGSGATIQIAAPPTHTHALLALDEEGEGATPLGVPGAIKSSNSYNHTYTTGGTNQAISHAYVTGSVGNVNAGNNGDTGFNTGSSGTGSTSGVTGGPGSTQTSNVNSGYSAVLGTDAGQGGGTTGDNNPPYVTIDYIIRAV